MPRSSPYPFVPIKELLLVAAACMFDVGSFFFVKGPTYHLRKGDALFIGGSFLFWGVSLHNICSQWASHGTTLCDERHLLAEHVENIFYNLSSIIFIGGCVLYWPGLFDSEGATLRAEVVAVWLFIIGSVGFVISCYCNAVLLSRGRMFKKIPHYGQIMYNMAFVGLLFAQIGGVAFVSGSLLFRPGFRNHCNRDIREGWEDIASMLDKNLTSLVRKMSIELNTSESHLMQFMPHRKICADILNEGAWLFTVGSLLYTAQAIIFLFMACLKRYAVQDVNEDAEEEAGSSNDDLAEEE